MQVKIERLDHQGRGIAYINNKITFIDNALIGEEVEIKIIKEYKNYNEATVINYITNSDKRIKPKCPYFDNCGGCHLRQMSYNDTLIFKKEKVENILKKYANIDTDIKVIKNENANYYRNKINLKVINGKIGFYKKNTHELIEIDRCLNAEESINLTIMHLDSIGINNGDITIKTNQSKEIILVINSSDTQNIDIDNLVKHSKIVGIILNEKLIYGSNHFIENIGDYFFKESYNSFFQVNRYINEKLFEIINDNIDNTNTVVDLCCGVGTLSIVAAKNANKVYGIEIVENSIKDAKLNAMLNKITNIEFILGDAFKLINNIEDNIDTIIIDPPRNGISKDGIKSILNIKPNKIVYISCDPITLARDINILKDIYDIKKTYILDMFSYTYHVETVMVLEKKDV